MNRIQLVKQSHPALTDEDVALLLAIGYRSDEDMDKWTETLKASPIFKLMNIISLINSSQKGS